MVRGIAWWSCGEDLGLSRPGPGVLPLVSKLSAAKKKKKKYMVRMARMGDKVPVEMDTMCSGQHVETVEGRLSIQAPGEPWEAAESLLSLSTHVGSWLQHFRHCFRH